MDFKKILFPIGAGDDIEPRIYGALRVAKWFGAHMEILACQMDPSVVYNMKMTLRGGVLFDEFLRSAKADLLDEQKQNEALFNKICSELGVQISDVDIKGVCTAKFTTKQGKRSAIVEVESKFSGTFEAAVIKSGKNVSAIPRRLEKFSADNIFVSWTGTPQSSRALTSSLELLKKAKRVHCVTSSASVGQDDAPTTLKKLEEYFKLHEISASFEIIDTTSIPGEALLKAARANNSDLIVAGRHGENGLMEMVLGGTSRFFLEHTDIPVFM